MNMNSVVVGSAMIISFSLAGCASAPKGDVSPQGRTIQDISKQYKQGTDLVADGKKVKKEADVQIEAATAKKREGDSMIERGQTLMAESEQAFKQKASSGATN